LQRRQRAKRRARKFYATCPLPGRSADETSGVGESYTRKAGRLSLLATWKNKAAGSRTDMYHNGIFLSRKMFLIQRQDVAQDSNYVLHYEIEESRLT
jgi:hypothetical protein